MNREREADSIAQGGSDGTLTQRQARKLYKKAIFYSLAVSLAIIQEGYDIILMGSFLGLAPFMEKYGDQYSDELGKKIISAPWQSGLQCGRQVGSIIGLYLSGLIAESIGYKKTMGIAIFLQIVFIFLEFFAQNIQTLQAAIILLGIPWGIFLAIPLSYAADVTPTSLRGYLTSYINLCFVAGQLVGTGVIRACSDRMDQWAYRIPFAIQWAWMVPLLGIVLIVPESPWWLVRVGRLEEAKKTIRRLVDTDGDIPFDVDGEVLAMKATNELERAMVAGTGYLDCFRGVNLRRTEVVSMAWLTQSFCGSGLMIYCVQFMQRAGLSDDDAFSMNVGTAAIGVLGTIASWFIMNYAGRRTMYICGVLTMFAILMVIGGLGVLGNDNRGASWGVGGLIVLFSLCYDLTVGPFCFAIVSETPATRLRVKSVAIARNTFSVGSIILNILMPRMIGVNAWNWGAKTGFFWAGSCVFLFVWIYFRLPETAGRSFEELDLLFQHGVDARKFASVDVSQLRGDHIVHHRTVAKHQRTV